MHIGQTLDRVRLALQQHALNPHQITGQEHDDDLAPAILDNAGPRDPAGFEQVDRSALLAGADKEFALATPDGGPHRLSDRRVAADQQIAELGTVQRKTIIWHVHPSLWRPDAAQIIRRLNLASTLLFQG